MNARVDTRVSNFVVGNATPAGDQGEPGNPNFMTLKDTVLVNLYPSKYPRDCQWRAANLNLEGYTSV